MKRSARSLQDLADIFDSFYIPEPNSGCWLWLGYLVEGYGQIRCENKYQSAHRLSYRIHTGPIVNELHVLHKCDNRICVNPQHLFLGTISDNNVDCVRKGRRNAPKNEQHWNCKLTSDEAREIRDGRQNSSFYADKFGVSKWLVDDIRAGRRRTYL